MARAVAGGDSRCHGGAEEAAGGGQGVRQAGAVPAAPGAGGRREPGFEAGGVGGPGAVGWREREKKRLVERTSPPLGLPNNTCSF